MKSLYFFVMVAVPMTASEVIAQVLASPSPSASPTAVSTSGAASGQWLIDLMAKYPKLATLLVVVGALRLVLKPTFDYLHTLLPAVGLTKWDSDVTAVEQSKPVKAIFWLLNYLGSINVPVAAAPTQPTASAAPTTPPAAS